MEGEGIKALTRRDRRKIDKHHPYRLGEEDGRDVGAEFR
jgi:hypothetical protein